MLDRIDDLKKEWKKNGYVILKNVLTKEDVSSYLKRVKEVSGMNENDINPILEGKKAGYVGTQRPLVRDTHFWDLFINKKVLEFIRNVIDDNICFGGIDGMFVHRSGVTLHRDSFISVDNLTGPDFDPNLDTLNNIRVATNLVENDLIVVPGSHRKEYKNRNRGNFKEFQDIAKYIKMEPGDIVIFDTMLLHAGRYLTKEKYMLVWNYMSRNMHTVIFKYYTHIILGLDSSSWDKQFIRYLEKYNLFWPEMWDDGKYYEYFKNLWKAKPNALKEKENTDYLFTHWSPYKEKLY